MKQCLNHYLKRTSRLIVTICIWLRDLFIDSRGNKNLSINSFFLRSDIEMLNFSVPEETLKRDLRQILEHKFDVFGITNKQWNRDFCVSKKDNGRKNFRGKIAKSNYRKASNILKRISNEKYEGIDWWSDIDSGYQWSPTEWYAFVHIPDAGGADIKVPWEIGRLQHLPRLAIESLALPSEKAIIKAEFENELLDFIAMNPIRWGVQYKCSMDIGIRIANITLAYSIMEAAGNSFSKDFNRMLANSIYDQTKHIFCNLEKSETYNNNHYLANLVGLIYGGIFLGQTRQTRKWIDYAKNELVKEINSQFNLEGTNKEGSSAYHLLSTEIVVCAFALLLAKKELDISDDELIRLMGSKMFIDAISRDTKGFSIIGDNDSGRLFHFFDNRISEVKDCIDAFLGMDRNYSILGQIIRNLVSDILFVTPCVKITKEYSHNIEILDAYSDTLLFKRSFKILAEYDLENVKLFSFPSFGIFVWKSKDFYLCVNVSDIGQNNMGGHSHNDKLSFELYINDKPIFVDPGTYVYSSSEYYRNLYRSAQVHNVIYTGEEQNEFCGCFGMKKRCYIEAIEVTEKKFSGLIRFGDTVQKRVIELKDQGIFIWDFCNKEIISNKIINCCFEYGVISDEKNNCKNIEEYTVPTNDIY